ncbi:MAG TPA: redoxin domain-containing protein [Cryomorphaceae bacterium]|nr:redoxin domain-containing protein [Cryomorphaceae bacterium]
MTPQTHPQKPKTHARPYAYAKRNFQGKLLLGAFLMIFACTAGAQNQPYVFEIRGVADSTIYLANYYGEKLYYADTAVADANGRFAFDRVDAESEGKYAVVLPGPRYFEIMIADGEDIHMKTDTADPVGHMQVLESDNNAIMYDYVKFLAEKRQVRETLAQEIQENEGNPEVTARLKERYNALNDEVVAYQTNIVEGHPDKLIAMEIHMSMDVQPPAELHEDRQAAYLYYKRHYFDHMDLTDDRLVRLPLFHQRLVNYLNNVLLQNPDTVIAALDKLIDGLDPGGELFKYVLHYSTYNFETSKIMGMDAVFVHLADKYYKPGMAYWLDDEQVKRITEKADEKRHTLIGKKAPELILSDTTGNWISTHRDIKKDYVVLFFYDPDCGHCKKETPKLVDYYANYPGDDLAIYAVSSNPSDKWNKFIRQYGTGDFYNVSIPQRAFEDADYATSLITSGKTNYNSLRYHEIFDVFSTPKIFILDKDRVIRAKDIGVEQVAEIIERLHSSGAEAGN